MGRLFWKFFFFIFLAQLAGMVAVGTTFWFKHHAEEENRLRLELLHPPGQPPQGQFPPPHHRPPHSPIPFIPLVAALLASLVCAWLLAWYFSKPIRSLRNAFEATASGNLDVRLGMRMGNRRDELADLGHDFDRMTGQLNTLMQAQRRLLHDVSHELRSPLARLQAAIGLARQRPEKLETTLERIELESVRIDQLVGELLTLSRLDAGVMGSMEEEVDMGELLAGILEDARFEAEAIQRSIDFAGNGNVVVRGRADLLHHAIENVVRNALKHTPASCRVTVTAASDVPSRSLLLTVQDEGTGIPEAELARIFEPFFRSEAAQKTDGHGLGLAIALRVIEAHGGTIRASNRSTGGLCVEISIPVLRAENA